jgi:S-(hydroxymethyl)glutathione dehydrogenase/alcohol dehydrogenase
VIPKDIPLDVAALLGCAVTTGLGLVSNEAQIKMGQSVVVFGCGGVGLNVLQGSMLTNAYPIIGVDIGEQKLRQALVMGATCTLDARMPNLKEAIYSEVGSAGADVVIDTTGNPDIIKTAWEIANATGKVHLVAQVPKDKHIALQTLPMHQGRAIMGSDGGGTDPTVDIPRYVKLLKAGRLNLAGLVTHRCKLHEINGMLDSIRAGKVGRALIEL